MSEGSIFFAVTGIVVWAIIIYNIIQSASKAKQIELYQKKQTFLLAKMAQKAGVSDEEINKIINLKSWESFT